MKKARTLAFGLVVLVAFPILGTAEDDKDAGSKKENRRAELLKKYDKNGDGTIDNAEKEAAREGLKKERAEKKKKKEQKKEQKKSL